MKDFEFVKMSTYTDGLDYHGYNTKAARETGQSKKPGTKLVYAPIIDRPPADPSTMLTAMCEAKRLTKEAGQNVTIFTADQQLYKVMVDITWDEKEEFNDFIPCIGGIHWLMSFVGCVGTLMANSGLAGILKSTFAGTEKMLSGKKFPMNVRALRLVVLEILRGKIDEVSTYSEFENFLNEQSKKGITCSHWINNLIRPVLLMMLYVHAEPEGEWALHLYACKEMIPYFFCCRSFQLPLLWNCVLPFFGKAAQ